jgi:PAS domain S-box-containing protein
MAGNIIQELFQSQIDYIYFFQGLAFFLVFVVCCLLRSNVDQRLPWRWFALFSLGQGLAAWLSLLAMNFGEPAVVKALTSGLQILSLIFLTEFGRSGLSRNQDKDSGLWLFTLLLMLTALGGLKGWPGIQLVSRYTLGLVGGLWAALALILSGHDLSYRDRGSRFTVSFCLGLFSVSNALFPPPSLLYPATFLNQALFLRLTSLPLELFQGLLGFGMAAGIYGYLPWRQKEEELQETRHRSRYLFALLTTLSVVLGLGSVLTLYLGEWAHAKHEQIKAEAHEYAGIMVTRLNSEFRRVEEGVVSLAKARSLALALRTRRDDYLERANVILDREKDALGASVCYLMDKSGKTIASSNRRDPDSFVGHNYAFRPYFTQAIDGGIGRYFAVGVTSKVPGYYASYPVVVSREEGIQGVVVIKYSLDNIIRELKTAVQRGDSLMCLSDPRGVVFLASEPDMIFKSLWPVADQDRAELRKQYGKDNFSAIFPEKIGEGSKVELNGRNYLASHVGTIHAGWSVFFFRPIERVNMYRLTGIAVACLLSILAMAILGGNFYLKENTVAATGWFQAIFNSAPEAISVVDPETLKIVAANKSMTDSLGYTPQKLLSLKLVDLLDHNPKEIRDQLQQVVKDEGIMELDWRALKKDGTFLDLEIKASRLTHRGKDHALIFSHEAALELRPLAVRFQEGDYSIKPSLLDEFNNILSFLIMQTELALTEVPKENEVCRGVEEMLKYEMRAKDLLRELAFQALTPLPQPELVEKREQIMLVDNQAQLCRLEVKVLQRLGYGVSPFTDNKSALEAFQANPNQFDLVIIDCSLSSSGLNLAQELMWLRPDVPIILAAGLGESDKIARAKQMGIKEFIEKPILTKHLERIIQRILEGQTVAKSPKAIRMSSAKREDN